MATSVLIIPTDQFIYVCQKITMLNQERTTLCDERDRLGKTVAELRDRLSRHEAKVAIVSIGFGLCFLLFFVFNSSVSITAA